MRPAIDFFIYSAVLLALSPAASFGVDRVVIGNVSRTVEQLPNYAATDKGFFTQEGIQGDVVLIGSTDTLIQALISGQINVAIVDPSAAINAVERGASLKIIGGTVPVAAYTLVTCPKYKSIKDLKGQTIGVTGLITSDTVLMKEMLKANGLEYPRDYAMLAIGGTPERWIAMQSGNVAAGILSPPFTFAADEAGFVNLGSTAKYTPNFPQTVFNVRTEWAQEKRPVLVRFLRAVVRASHWIHAQKEDTVRIIAKRFKFSEKHSEAAWRYFISNNAIPTDGEVNAKGMDKVMQLLVEDGTIHPPLPKTDKYMDMSYLDEARRAAQ
jgi:NitT/TauT family transport system substrate-binding protein